MATTKDESLSKQPNMGHLVANNSEKDKSSHFSNLNLNQNHKCLNGESHVHFDDESNRDKNFDIKNYWYAVTADCYYKEKSWKRSTKDLHLKNLKNQCLNYEIKKETRKRWMNDKNDGKNNKNKSTLSLHIAAYENSVEAKFENQNLQKKPKAIKYVAALPKLQTLQNAFEFPRQMGDSEPSTLEVQQFTASQKLLSLNQSAGEIDGTQSFSAEASKTMSSRNLSENERDDTGDYVVMDDEDDGIDNEDTIAEDELHVSDNDLEALQAEAEMDIEELRKRYYGEIVEAANEGQNAGSSDAPRNDGEEEAEGEEEETSEEEEEISSELVVFMNAENGVLQDYGSDDDDEYAPKIYKPPRVGPEFQHLNIPGVDSTYKPIHDHADVLWKPTSKMNDQQLDQYQESVLEFSQDIDASKLPALQSDPVQPRMDRPIPFWDSEEALYTLMQNDYDPVKAKKAFSENPPDVNLPRKTHFGIYLPWDEGDLLKFETGLHVYLKKFNKIQQEYLPGRSIGEVIHFYYRWKKTERFDMWRQQHQHAYAYAQDLQPNSTDIMENIIELIERDDVPAAEANVLVAEAQAITAQIHGQPPP